MPTTDSIVFGLPASLAPWLALAYLLMSVACFIVYARDKAAARAGRRRTPEATLLWLGLACGWPGGLLAQRWLRHKTAKASFQWRFWITVLVNGLLLAAVWLGPGWLDAAGLRPVAG